ncbi:MAG: YerC/YecD family TrpR-related protein [bacterium]|nr:YerC/YecD family TrpR-related protein [bacterium]
MRPNRSLNHKQNLEDLFKALELLESPAETKGFLKDLCTPSELNAMAERWNLARLLWSKNHSYREISELTGASTTTVGRVARFLFQEDNKGYQNLINRMEKL